MGEVDPAFILDLEHRPKLAVIEADGIPLIDLSELNSGDGVLSDSSSLVSDIGEACKKWGFFQVINHGVPSEKRDKLESASREFFALPLEEKVKVRKDEANVLGYYEAEHTKNVRDWREVFDLAAHNPITVPASTRPDDDSNQVVEWHNQWPQYPPNLREACEEYVEEVEKLGFKMLELIALSLGLPADRFNGFFKDQTSYMRLVHYPPCPAPELALGLGRHNDGGAVTILAQDDVGGLEVKRKSDGEWIRVKPTPDAFIVNVGDVMQVWTNERYESVEHRVVVNSERDRFAIPFFLNPAHYTIVKPLEELTSEENPARYRPYSWGKFHVTRRGGNFKKLDVPNIQISQFRVANIHLEKGSHQ